MSEEKLLASFEAPFDRVMDIIRFGHAPLEERYDQMYLNVAEDEIRTVANASDNVASYCTFNEKFVNDIHVDDSVDSVVGMESVINVFDIQDYLQFVGGSVVEVRFYGYEDDRLAARVDLDGDLCATVYLPHSRSDVESKKLNIMKLYDSDNRWVRPSTFDVQDGSADDGEPLGTTFVTDIEEFEKIVKASNFDDITFSNFPVVIEDGELVLEAADEDDRNKIEGTLHAEEVEGDNVRNVYSRGLDELVGNISGNVRVGIEQDGPVSIVREANDGAFIARYSIANIE